MSILKLQHAGESYTMTVTACEEVQGQYGPQVKFDGGGATLFLPKESADRQLARLGFNTDVYFDVVGQALTFSRTPNPKPGSKPYWNIDRADAKRPAKAAAKPVHQQDEGSGAMPFDDVGMPPEPPELVQRPRADLPPAKATTDVTPDEAAHVLTMKREAIESAYRWAVDASMRAQSDLFIGELSPTADSVQAGAATLLIQAEKRSAI